MSGIAKKLLDGGELRRALAIPSLDVLGSRSGDLGARRLADAAFVTNAVLNVVLGATPLGQHDPAAVLGAVLRQRGAGDTLAGKALLSLANGANAVGEDGLVVLGKAWRDNLSSHDKGTARTILSLLVSMRVDHRTIKRVCSFLPTLEAADQVYVKRGPNLRTGAVVVSTTKTHVVVVGPTLSVGCETFPLEHVVRHDAIECTQHQISRATHHAAERFPGAAVLKEEIIRAGNLSPERAEAVANFLRDPTVRGGGGRVVTGGPRRGDESGMPPSLRIGRHR
jgi:hypothetical protein